MAESDSGREGKGQRERCRGWQRCSEGERERGREGERERWKEGEKEKGRERENTENEKYT